MTRAERQKRDAAICAAYPGQTMQEIADTHGITRQAVSLILKKNGKSPTREQWRERQAAATRAAVTIQWDADMNAALRDGIRRGHKMEAIAKRIGVCVQTAIARADQLGLPRKRRAA